MSSDAARRAERRSYRYLRISLVGVVVVLIAAFIIESSISGTWLPSISHYYYTPARNVFVGALVAASVSLLVLSGTDAEGAWLDVAATFAPLIALIPVAVDPAVMGRYGEGLTFRCEGVTSAFPPGTCIPVEFVPGVVTGVLSYLVAVLLVLIVALALWLTKQLEGPWIWLTILVGLGVFVAVLIMLLPVIADPRDTSRILLNMHLWATLAFFACFTAVPIVNARAKTSDIPPKPWQRRVYLAVAVLLPLTVIATAIMGVLAPAWFGVLIGEVIALALFALFWIVQTVQRWNEDPGAVRETRRLTPADMRPPR